MTEVWRLFSHGCVCAHRKVLLVDADHGAVVTVLYSSMTCVLSIATAHSFEKIATYSSLKSANGTELMLIERWFSKVISDQYYLVLIISAFLKIIPPI